MITETTTETQTLSLEDELAELTSNELHRICLGACNPSVVPGATVTLFCGATKIVEIGQRPLDGDGPACVTCDVIAETHNHTCPRCGWRPSDRDSPPASLAGGCRASGACHAPWERS